ncbi:MAG: flagellar export chaperone FlgN [Desulfovibrionaceae bacterium]|nr:flagellar export chaperone FlgN [Desulfovibrionaceae bacterium]
MDQVIYASLIRQVRGLDLLRELLGKEYRVLCERKMEVVAAFEFSIQELIRQLVNEKEFVMQRLRGQRLLEYAKTLEPDSAQALLDLVAAIDASEQKVSAQASLNSQLSLALLDQNEKNLQTLFKQAVPEKTMVYGRHGAMRQVAAQGALISGRL